MFQGNPDEPSGLVRDDDDYQPWYKDSIESSLPYQLIRKISLANGDDLSFHSLILFPWDNLSLKRLWPEGKPKWRTEIVAEYSDAVAAGSEHALYIFFTRQKQAPICVTLPTDRQQLLPADRTRVAWGLVTGQAGQKDPVVIVSRGSLVYIYNVVHKGLSGWIRGHGGAITSISIHPTTPHIFCTTSRDFTTRIYDLRLSATYTPDIDKKGKPVVPNPHWPPGKLPSQAGAAHGLRLPPSEREGVGNGRCIIVLQGGRSGGHEAAVMASAFHPSLPLIATAGMDRAVKIWAIRPGTDNSIKREDKPLFSSTRIHKARVLSISWLRDDLLLTHSAPAIMRCNPNSKKDKATRLDPGELTIWQWIALNRFFPPEQRENPQVLKGLRGISSDYQESSSFKIISTHTFPSIPTQYDVPNLSLFQTAHHDPVILFVYPGDFRICILNASHMAPRRVPPFPAEAEKLLQNSKGRTAGDGVGTSALTRAAGRLRIDQSEDGDGEQPEEEEEDDDDDDEDGEEDAEGKGDGDSNGDSDEDAADQTPFQRPEIPYPPIQVWGLDINEGEASVARLIDCQMGMGGRMIIGVGTKGCVWVWGLQVQSGKRGL